MNTPRGYGMLLRIFGSALLSQAALSAAGFLIGLILIRRTSDTQYGYYILAIGAFSLLTSLQNAFFSPSMVIRMTGLDAAGRGAVMGGLYRAQRRLLPALAIPAALIAAGLWMGGLLNAVTGPLALAVAAAIPMTLSREYFHTALLAYRRPQDVLKCDSVYVVVLVTGIFAATLTQAPALLSILSMGVAALVGGTLLWRALRRHEAWNLHGAPGIAREVAPFALWSVAGAAIHWTFSQGYSYLVAATLDVASVGAIAATRLLLMPVSVLSMGLGAIMLPMVSAWLHEYGATTVLRRLTLIVAGLVAAALLYFTVLWLLRDWLFATVLKKQFAQRDQLLLLWSAAFLAMVARDQLMYLLIARARFHATTALTALSAVLSLAVSYWAMRRFGLTGAPMGVLTGELISFTGVIILSLRETRRSLPTLAMQAVPQ